ncbi:CheR family methyltransferase [Sphingomonas tabacisoli]|uniref:histidine kinase n=1 Tax=Sphingomonas tabacisoli TaxID=2249466 RepID=A0ABW4I6D7_9SPHN
MARNGQSDKPAKRRKDEQPTEPIAVVGVGVGSASLRSLEELFAGVDGLGAAYVIAIRQQDGPTVETIIGALQRHTKLPIKVASDGEKLEPGHVYVGGRDDLITITDGHIRTRVAEQPIGHRGTVDTMLMSIAEHAQDRAVAVILTGLGSEGTAGVTATKNFGGLSIAESVNGEAEAAAQGAATPAGIVDLLLPIEQIPAQIALYIRGLETIGTSDAGADVPEAVAGQLTQIANILRNVTGNDFHGYKTNTFLRRVQRRMQVVQVATIEAYIGQLKKDREEVQHLFQDLLIGVTQFFRDPAEFEALQRELPKLFEAKGNDDQFRVWVLGCATGEEAYSIAILLAEYIGTLDNPPHVQIFATDLDARALGAARAGRYASTIAEHVSPERLARWFIKEGDTYCVVKELREMCIFSPHNLIKDAPFSRIDLLSCRNLLIYLNSELQDRVIPIFHFSLRPGGILFLGSSENVTRHQKLFAPVDRRNRLFRRVETAIRVLPEFPLSARAGRRDIIADKAPTPLRPAGLAHGIGRRAAQVAERYAPAYVVIDRDQEVLHFSGRTGGYLEPATGAATLNLLNLVHRDLRLDLRSAIHRAGEEMRRIETPPVPMRDNGDSALVKMIVEPIVENGDLTAIMVVFQNAGPLPESPATMGGQSDEHVERLEAELRLTKERLQATIEELESTNEELKSSNEEYQSINEELQSANEELETSKEELQSVNEELQTVNAELGHRVADLARANSDLKNLLESTQIATIFLDNELRVRSFTPAATDVFHLLDTDVGRPIEHLGSRVPYPELSEDVRKVLTKLGTVEREVTSREGGHYIARVHPYRSVDNFIAGAVLTFLDVTGTVRAESALRESEARLRVLLAELQHRVRNTLAVVKSITNRTAESSATVVDMAEHLIGRLDAFARVQAAVTRAPEASISLSSLIEDEMLADAMKQGEQFSIDGPPVELTHKAAESLSLAFHELATNAVKHGGLKSNGRGVDVSWRLDGEKGDRLHLVWQEHGGNGSATRPEREGFGMELLTRLLPYELDARSVIEFEPEGLRFSLEMPVGG